MSAPWIQLRHLVFIGPGKDSASLKFGPGFNLVYGASDTGKSFIVEAIDFMLGKSPPLTSLKEREGYTSILLGIETSDSLKFTLQRAVEGGDIAVYDGLLEAISNNKPARILNPQHKNKENLSGFLLEKIELNNRRLRKNASGETVSLTLRTLLKLVIIDEDEIHIKKSPLKTGNPNETTPLYSLFKTLLTGTDDSSIIKKKSTRPDEEIRGGKIEVVDQLIEDYLAKVPALEFSTDDIEGQMEKVAAAIKEKESELKSSEQRFKELSAQRNELRSRADVGRNRIEDLRSLLKRFELLSTHYQSDLERLQGIEEAGTLFALLETTLCPLCGAEVAQHQNRRECDGNVDAVVVAAQAESAKIALLRKELTDTSTELLEELHRLERNQAESEAQLEKIVSYISIEINPTLGTHRSSFAELVKKKSMLDWALFVEESIADLRAKKASLENSDPVDRTDVLPMAEISSHVLDKFAQTVETILRDWNFPNAQRVFFDPKASDLVINGKTRNSYGKGLRAITQAAFTLGLLEYCRVANTPHPGFVILDSPLLAYRKPEVGTSNEDETSEEALLLAADVKERFFEWMSRFPSTRQAIVIENVDPIDGLKKDKQVHFFSGTPGFERPGLFPVQP